MARSLEEWQLDDYLRSLLLHKWGILLITLLFGGYTALQMAQQPNIYRAATRILIETDTPRYLRFQEVMPYGGRGSDREFLQTEYQVIASRAVMSQVVDNLHLAAFPPFSRAKDPVRRLQSMVAVQPVRGTKLVDIGATGLKPELISRIADSVADTYARLNLERRRSLTSGGIGWIQKELEKMEEKIQAAQQGLHNFLEENSGVDFGVEQQKSVLQRLQALNAALTNTRKERIEAQTRFRQKHPKILELQAKEQELQLALFDQEQRALEANRLSIQYSALHREVKTSEQIYNILLTRMKQLSVQEGLETNNVQVVDYAIVPDFPIGPPRRSRTSSSAMVGFAIGCGLAILRELLSRTIRTRQEFEQLLEIPFLGHLPMVQKEHLKRGAATFVAPNIALGGFGEALRSVRTTLEFVLPSAESHLLLVTSSLPEEGKTFCSVNLAVALHELGRKVLLIDGDLRRPSLHRMLKIPLEPGLSGFLEGRIGEEELIQTVPSIEGFPVVAAGMSPTQPTDLLSSPKLAELLKSWRAQFQYILIDSPPTLVAADSVVLASATDGVIFVVRANRTHDEAAIAGKQRLVDVGAKILGGILNVANLQMERGYRYYYSYRYYHSKGYGKERRGHRPSRRASGDSGISPIGPTPGGPDETT